ncbi:hypothetical protein WQ57_15570 [Mesobacillus campisalis]|uniref:Uncharacterized protein n=1 Tax=Mesobacillus campisalis TaxID=1408103 RepID=A0A0M2SVZ5_9BACI|nr:MULTISPECIES: hypothetical protein [Bacillaceae]KKK37142.1 hypothetical protein WQ57_15570 [Mesobacillus campisalis]
MKLHKDMQFKIKEGFMANLHSSDTLTILEVTPSSVVIQMNKSNGRGVFPYESFEYWVKRGLLAQMNDHHKRTS